MVRRQRKVGNLPPIYPNGWFVLLESDDLKKGQVVHVAALGKSCPFFLYYIYQIAMDNQLIRLAHQR